MMNRHQASILGYDHDYQSFDSQTQQKLGVSSVLVTHDMASAYYATDRIAMLYKGKIVQLGNS